MMQVEKRFVDYYFKFGFSSLEAYSAVFDIGFGISKKHKHAAIRFFEKEVIVKAVCRRLSRLGVKARLEKKYKHEDAFRVILDFDSEYLYLLRSENGLTKIGVTNNVVKRVRDLSAASPVGLSLVRAIRTEIPYELEHHLHQRYAKKRVRGEWFELDDEDLALVDEEIKNAKSLHPLWRLGFVDGG